MIHAFVTAFTAGCRTLAAQITAELQGAELSVGDESDDDGSAPCVLAVGECVRGRCEELAAKVAAVSRRGARRVLVVIAGGTEQVWHLLGEGASDVVVWKGSHCGAAVAARLMRWHEIEKLILGPAVRRMVVGESPAWQRALRRVVEITRWSRATVLVTGESGTGKELVARLIHELRPDPGLGDLVIMDATT